MAQTPLGERTALPRPPSHISGVSFQAEGGGGKEIRHWCKAMSEIMFLAPYVRIGITKISRFVAFVDVVGAASDSLV